MVLTCIWDFSRCRIHHLQRIFSKQTLAEFLEVISRANQSLPNRTPTNFSGDNIRKLIIRDLADASITALSADRRFATAYNAALQAAAMTVLCSGYYVSARAGHHQITFEAAHLAIGSKSRRVD
jgi:hypothetical protein